MILLSGLKILQRFLIWFRSFRELTIGVFAYKFNFTNALFKEVEMSGSQKCSFCSRGLDEIRELFPSSDGKLFICFDCSRVALEELTEKLPAELTRRPILRARTFPHGRPSGVDKRWGRPYVAPDLTKKLGDEPVHGAYLSRTVGAGILRIPEIVCRLVSREVCERHTLIPLQLFGHLLIVAIVGTDNQNAADDLKFLTGFDVNFICEDEENIKAAIELHYGQKFKDEVFL